MPSKKPKTKTNQTSVQQRRTEKRADLTHLPPDPESRSRPLLFGLTPPRGLLLRPQRKTKKNQSVNFSAPFVFPPGAGYYDFTNTNTTCVHLEQAVTFALRSFSRLCAKQRERKKRIKTNEQLLTKQKKQKGGKR